MLYRYGHIYMTKELQPYNIGKGQFLFLLALCHKDGLPQEELAVCLNIDKGTTARAISKLEKSGYVIKKQNKKDLRANMIFLTEKAINFKPQLFTILHHWSNVLSEGMNEEDKEKAFYLLTKMAHNASNYIQKDKNKEGDK